MEWLKQTVKIVELVYGKIKKYLCSKQSLEMVKISTISE